MRVSGRIVECAYCECWGCHMGMMWTFVIEVKSDRANYSVNEGYVILLGRVIGSVGTFLSRRLISSLRSGPLQKSVLCVVSFSTRLTSNMQSNLVNHCLCRSLLHACGIHLFIPCTPPASPMVSALRIYSVSIKEVNQI